MRTFYLYKYFCLKIFVNVYEFVRVHASVVYMYICKFLVLESGFSKTRVSGLERW